MESCKSFEIQREAFEIMNRKKEKRDKALRFERQT